MAPTILAGAALVHFCIQHSAEPSIRTFFKVHGDGDRISPGERGALYSAKRKLFVFNLLKMDVNFLINESCLYCSFIHWIFFTVLTRGF